MFTALGGGGSGNSNCICSSEIKEEGEREGREGGGGGGEGGVGGEKGSKYYCGLYTLHTKGSGFQSLIVKSTYTTVSTPSNL